MKKIFLSMVIVFISIFSFADYNINVNKEYNRLKQYYRVSPLFEEHIFGYYNGKNISICDSVVWSYKNEKINIMDIDIYAYDCENYIYYFYSKKYKCVGYSILHKNCYEYISIEEFNQKIYNSNNIISDKTTINPNEMKKYGLQILSDYINKLNIENKIAEDNKRRLDSIYYENNKYKMVEDYILDSIAVDNYINMTLPIYNKYYDKNGNWKNRFGYIIDYGFDLNCVNGIEPMFEFYNTSNKIVKYVHVYFKIYNAVNDICLLQYNQGTTAQITGVGPINPSNSATYNWNSATHYTSGDASHMKIIKIKIDYMDNTSYTFQYNNLPIDIDFNNNLKKLHYLNNFVEKLDKDKQLFIEYNININDIKYKELFDKYANN